MCVCARVCWLCVCQERNVTVSPSFTGISFSPFPSLISFPSFLAPLAPSLPPSFSPSLPPSSYQKSAPLFLQGYRDCCVVCIEATSHFIQTRLGPVQHANTSSHLSEEVRQLSMDLVLLRVKYSTSSTEYGFDTPSVKCQLSIGMVLSL